MRVSTRLSRWIPSAALLVLAVAVSAGCATNGRHVLLKEYGPTASPADCQSLKGVTVCIKGFECVPSLTSPDPTTKPEQPDKFAFMDFTPEQGKAWDQEFKVLEKSTSKDSWRQIGNVRNGFGMVLSHVYALNDPGAWLADTLKMDLESQGAKVVDASQVDAADVSVSGTVQFCRVDIYMKIWGDLVVNLELKPKQGNPLQRVLHTNGGTLAWAGSTAEFYKPLRECRQKFSWLVAREISKTLKQ